MKPNYEDERGKITDLMVTPEYSVTHITFNEGCVRGNHYHKQTTQFDTILKGKLIVAQDDNQTTVSTGQGVSHPPNVKHAYQAIEPSEMISICWGVRKGDDYSKDTYKLDIPLL